MVDHIVSVDAGNAGTNAVLAKQGGGYKAFYEPSVRATATGASLGLGADFELEYTYIEWNGFRYVSGDDVLRVTKRNLERHMGVNRYGDEFHQFLVATALAKLGIKSGTVGLTLFAPPGFYLEAKQRIQDRFLEEEGRVEIKLKGDKKPRVWTYEKVTIWPEGIGAACCFLLDDEGEYIQTDVFSGETLVLDSGAYTLDALKFVNGNFNPEELEHATWENGGVHVHVREPILRTLRKQSEAFETLTIDDIDRVIRQGLVSGDYTIEVAGYEANIQQLVNKHAERYAEWVGNNICDGTFNSLRSIKSVILVGGGAVLIEEHLRKWYNEKILDRKKHPTVRKLHPVDMNAVGGLRLALMQQKQKQS